MLQDKVVVISGGASGIGKAIAEKFGRMGSKIGILDFNQKTLSETESFFKQRGIEIYALKCDVSNPVTCASSINKIIKLWGGIDILVNNAGITQRSLFRNTKLEVYRRIMDVNFFGTLNCTKPALESLIERKGTIVVTTSIAGIAPLYGRTGYSSSKHALHGFFESLRTELADQSVHVMLLCPYFTVTNLQDRALDGEGKINLKERSLIGKQASAESVAEAVYRGVLKRKRILVLTPMGKISYYLSRFFPGFYEKKMAEKIKPEFIDE